MSEKKLNDALDSLMKKELVVFDHPILQKYPNLQAIFSGCVSGNISDWPMIRVELKKLVEKLDEMTTHHLEVHHGLTGDCKVCGRPHF